MSRLNMIALTCAALLSIALAAMTQPKPTLLSADIRPWPQDPVPLTRQLGVVPAR
jgi:hypothetical protein